MSLAFSIPIPIRIPLSVPVPVPVPAPWRCCAASPIRLVACDMDGTLLTSDKRISARNASTISRLLSDTDVLFIPATGKSRAGAVSSLGPSLRTSFQSRYPYGCPGVFLQGLLVYDLSGTIIYERILPPHIIDKCASLSTSLHVDLIAYARDTIVCKYTSPFTDLLPSYNEPHPIVVPHWSGIDINKMIFMAHPDVIDEIRPHVQRQMKGHATLTQAQDNMLEVLPKGTNKGHGVLQLLKHVDVNPNNVMAIGDAENDIELLQLVRYSCAVDNALPSVKAVAKYTGFGTNDQDAVSNAISKLLNQPQPTSRL